MKGIDLKSLAVTEIAILFSIGLFSLDFLPRNYKEFLGICSETWPKDPKQYQICMQPYFRETGLDKYALGVAIAAFLAVLIYFFKKR
jgi:hypothetical protein